MLIAIPLALTGTGYALFSQQLSVTANSSAPEYTSSQNLSVSYDKDVSAVGQNWEYAIAVTIKNNGGADTTSWQSTFSLPEDYSNISCTDASCTQPNDVLTAVNTGANGTIPANGTLNYSFTFTSAEQNYRFTSLGVSGTLAPTYAPVTGLTVLAHAGTRTQLGQWYTRPYTFTVTNASGSNLDGWRITIPWDTATNQIASMPATVNYVEEATQLSIFSTQAISNGTDFQFTADLSSMSSAYVLSGYAVQGQQ
ncbi:MAG TPA: cellulose binding domain-containing protein [Candidatus Saccharimonadales bacterium]|nr:cellulose binding domain-containing protein [Candidatus Saccharimonadales bacterium]